MRYKIDNDIEEKHGMIFKKTLCRYDILDNRSTAKHMKQ